MRTILSLTLLVFLLSACGTARPLVYGAMTDSQRADEERLQQRLESSSEKIAGIVFKIVEDPDGKIAAQVLRALKLVEEALTEGDTSRALVDRTLAEFKLLDENVQDLARDAFDLFAGWVDVPSIGDFLPEVVRDRLQAFVRGGVRGLAEYVQDND